MTNIKNTISVNNRGSQIQITPLVDLRMREVKELKKNSIESKVDQSLSFKRNYQFNEAKPFFDEGCELINAITGEVVKDYEEGMLVFIPTIETTKNFFINQIYLSEEIEISINGFTVDECFKALAGDEAMASPASAKDWLQWSVVVTKDQNLKNALVFMQKNSIKNITTAMKYFNAVPTMGRIKVGAITGKFQTMEARTLKVAQDIFNEVFSKFGVNSANNRYVIDAINKMCANGYKLPEVLKAIKALNIDVVRQITIRGIGCLDKEECISNELTVKLQELGFKAERRAQKKVA